jgi:hypothetical protein
MSCAGEGGGALYPTGSGVKALEKAQGSEAPSPAFARMELVVMTRGLLELDSRDDKPIEVISSSTMIGAVGHEGCWHSPAEGICTMHSSQQKVWPTRIDWRMSPS